MEVALSAWANWSDVNQWILKLMDIVGRYSYHCDILFRVIDIRVVGDEQKSLFLYGEDFRLVADAPYEDLVQIDQTSMHKEVTTDFDH